MLAQLIIDKDQIVLPVEQAMPQQEREIAEMGLAYLEIFKAGGGQTAYERAGEAAMQLLSAGSHQYAENNEAAAYRGAFCGYFLLKYCIAKSDAPGNVYMPGMKKEVNLLPLPVSSVLHPDNPEICQVFIQANYRKTYALLQELLPDVLSDYQQLHGEPYAAVFAAYLRKCLEERKENPYAAAVMFEFEKEQFILSVRRSLKNSDNTLPDDSNTIMLEQLMHLSTAEFLSLRLVQAKGVSVRSWEPAVTMDMRFTVMEFADFFQHYGARTCICYVTRDDKLQETFPGIIRLIFDRFAAPVTIREALDQITDFIFRQPPAAVQLLKNHYEVSEDDRFLEKVHGLVIDGVRLYMMEEILEVIQ